MIQNIPENQLQHISSYILANAGLFFPPNKWNSLGKGIKSAAAKNGVDILTFIDHLLNPSSCSKQLVDELVSYLTIGETYFLRDKNLFQTLKDDIIQGIIDQAPANGKKINFLSAGCATGEEPYSIAILIDHLLPVLNDWKITIIGTDINAGFLEKAKTGVYSPWSLRETPERIVKKYFIQTSAHRFELQPHIKRMVNFFHLNLMEEDYGRSLKLCDKMDILLCRNVLMYFDDATRNQVVEKLTGLIRNNGWFITGPAESGFIQTDDLVPVKFSSAIIHQKKEFPAEEKSDCLLSPKTDDRKKRNYFRASTTVAKQFQFRPKQRWSELRPVQMEAGTYEEALKDYQNGNYKRSVVNLSKLLANKSEARGGILIETELMTLLAKAHANMGELDEASYWCQKAIESEKLNPEIYFLQSSIFQNAGKLKEAIRSLRQALYLDPEFIMAHFLIGMLLLQENNATESRKSMANALSLLKIKDPDEIISFSEGMTVARLIETITGILAK